LVKKRTDPVSRISRELGFSFLELVTVIVILGIVVFVAMPRLRVSDSGLLTSRDAIIAALSHAQQVAMARDSAANPVTIQVNADSVAVQEGGVNLVSPGAEYPFNLPTGVTVTGGVGTLHYDKMGRTSPTTISLNDGQATIAVETSGYAR
jgi:Tfp pilus assembly protein FimT